MNSDSDHEGEHLNYKIIVMGDGAVGKTSLINRYCRDGFAQSYKQTIGVDFFNKKIQLPGGVEVTLQIWDIGGQQIGGKMLGKYIYGCHAVLLVYDSTNAESFKNVDDWLTYVRQETQSQAKPPFLALAANKMDLPHRAVRTEKHTTYATTNRIVSFFVSAKTGEKVGSMFYKIAADLAGVQVTKAETETEDKTITATIVQHPTDMAAKDATASSSAAAQASRGGRLPEGAEKERQGSCGVM